ncbi:Cyclic nucleotide-binding domain-containing protein [Devosia enhydra]|uniref:Cyclic nucleotide-binding domain-containing protein n=1 Tax=Devosia enhydra TaxID=665118 RepID=A0A1K2HTX0_9HYPH|nr:cyclic nucleotide-binding domain-containing protein [Devosia enhydra]SFZ81724.1 Cyclic nucleotide-binding domain-containing protein [Devosia enhydra]
MTSPLTLDAFLGELFDPGKALTHIPYMLLVVSMLMRDMSWLRAFAITAGVIRIFNRSFVDQDFIVAFWETALVGINVGQLMVLWYYAKRARFSEEEKMLISNLDPSVSRRTVRRLLRLGEWRNVEGDTVLIEEGRPVANLVFVAEGVAQIERGERIVAVCGPGDFLGEMSFVSGKPANATVRTARPGRILSFPQSSLRHAMRNDEELRQAVESGLNRNLVGKLAKSG